MKSRLERITPALEDVDRGISNVLSVFPELRMQTAYATVLFDAEGNARAVRANSAFEGGQAANRAEFANFLRGIADALDNPEHHHHAEKRTRISAADTEGGPES